MAFPKIDGYVVVEKLGSGSYSVVYKAYTKIGARSVVAIKCVDKSRLKNSSSAIDNLVTEIRLLKSLTHPHIVQMKHFFWDERNIYIVTEYCCGGDLSKYIQRYRTLPELQVQYFLQQLATALKYLREKGVVHMDLKPHNLLLHKDSDGRLTLKVADFGFAQYLQESSSGGPRGSPLYMAPELATRGEMSPAVDLWSVGVILYECLFGKAPYASNSISELMTKIKNCEPIQFPQSPAVSEDCLSLLRGLLQHEPSARISYEEFFAHPYLDLEHMPTKENFDTAVSLIKCGVAMDSSGRLREALDAYCSALRYLLPALRHRDRQTRPVLQLKVIRYMERAEEIKQILEGKTLGSRSRGEQSTSLKGKPPNTVSPQDLDELSRVQEKPAPPSAQTSTKGNDGAATKPDKMTKDDAQRPKKDEQAGATTRSKLQQWFRRTNSNIIPDKLEADGKLLEETEDNCKIT